MLSQSFVTRLIVQFINPVEQMQFNAPVMLRQVTVVTDDEGKAVYHPAYAEIPAAPSNITDDMLHHLQVQLAAIGLTVARITPDAGE